MTYPNPDLFVNEQRLAGWNTPDRRRQSFRKLHLIHRRGLTLRSAEVLPLAADLQLRLGEVAGLQELAELPAFVALVVAQGDRILLERYAPDATADTLHSIQSITKTFVHAIMWKLLESGHIELGRPIGHYVPEAGTAYADATVQQALDMNVASNFSENYEAPYAPMPAPGDPVGYARQEISMGWRLPPLCESEIGIRAFASHLGAASRGMGRETIYASPNTDMLGWVIERASGRPLVELVEEIVEASGLASSFHISLDCQGVPVLSGGGVMTARDLARYGLLLARGWTEAPADNTGRSAFLADAMSGAGTHYDGSPQLRYRNHLLSNGTWVGHPGYAGQFLMIAPDKAAVAAFYSVLETPQGGQEGYFSGIISVLEGVLNEIT